MSNAKVGELNREISELTKRKVPQKATKIEQGKYSSKYALSELLVCGCCGARYRRVTWARNGKKKVVWRCISRLEYWTKYCKESPTIEEYQLQDTLMKAICGFVEDKDELIGTLKCSLRMALEAEDDIIDTAAITSRMKELLGILEQADFNFKEYDEALARQLISKVTVVSAEEIQITFKGGFEVEQRL
jgi:hypothetical protein